MGRTLDELDREWRRLARDPQARRTLIRWVNTHAELGGIAALDDLLAARLDPDRAEPVLKVLAKLAPADHLAARVLLQAMLPGLIRLGITAGYDDPRALDELVALAWERIRTFPPGRDSVAPNILMDVKKRYRRHREIDAPTKGMAIRLEDTADSDDSEEWDREELAGNVPPPEDIVLEHLLLEALLSAQRTGLVSGVDLGTIIRTRVGGERLADVAMEQGLNPASLRHRRWRAERLLRTLPIAG